jgi:hypothetical protein
MKPYCALKRLRMTPAGDTEYEDNPYRRDEDCIGKLTVSQRATLEELGD